MASKSKKIVEEDIDVIANTRSSNKVTIFCNMPSGISFDLPNGKSIKFNGYPVSRLVGPDGQALPAGKFGITENVDIEIWEYIKKAYRECAFFNTPEGPLLFEAADIDEARAKAKEYANTRHGLEQIDVNKTDTKKEEV